MTSNPKNEIKVHGFTPSPPPPPTAYDRDLEVKPYDVDYVDIPRLDKTVGPAAGNILALFQAPLAIHDGPPGSDTAPVVVSENRADLPFACREALMRSVIAVHCGIQSDGLCAIRFTSTTKLEEFRRLNPALKDALSSRSSNHYHLWIRPPDLHPAGNATLASCEWKARGAICLFERGAGGRYGFLTPGSPARVSFAKIRWLPEDELQMRTTMRKVSHGPPFTGTKPNLFFWAAEFIHSLGFLYSRKERCFRKTVDGRVEYFGDEFVRQNLITFLSVRAAVQDYRLQELLLEPALTKTLRTVKALAEAIVPSQEFPLEDFIKQHCRPQPGAALTANEIFSAFGAAIASTSGERVSRELRQSVADIVYRLFQIPRSNSVKRDGIAQVGFRGLGWTPPPTQDTASFLGDLGTVGGREAPHKNPTAAKSTNQFSKPSSKI